MTERNSAFDAWSRSYQEDDGTALVWPSETLVRLLRGPYVRGFDREHNGRRAIEVGFGSGNNLRFLASLGLDLAGTEVSGEICDVVGSKLHAAGINADLRVGTNTSIPFPNGAFDYLVSWNVLHYEPNENEMRAAIAEYARVLSPAGRCFISTTGPDHDILNGAQTLGAHRYRLGAAADFRDGEVMFYFDSPRYIEHYFESCFDDIRVGRSHTELFGSVLDWFIITAVRRPC